MPDKVNNIWIYNDEGVSELSMKSAFTTFQSKLPAHNMTTVRLISSADILNGKLIGRGILVMPGGADMPYCHKLNGAGNDIIRQFVARGNIYIGICAGGYYGAQTIEFLGEGYEISGSRELAFFSGAAVGSMLELTHGQRYNQKTASKALATLNYANGQQDKVYYHGGAYFVGDAEADFKVLATYSSGKNAIVSGCFEQGRYLLSGVHFELCPQVYAECSISHESSADREKERALLLAIDNDHYGSLVYQEIEKMLGTCL